jgi:CTP-dependent riboflavin kinase
VSASAKIQGVIFSDLGIASRFMSLDWVQRELAGCLGFAPFPATLNLRPADAEDAAAWEAIQNDASYFSHMPVHEGACRARIYRVTIHGDSAAGSLSNAAVLLPEVKDYPPDKIEIVAPVRVKDAFGVTDGDRLTLEFLIE